MDGGKFKKEDKYKLLLGIKTKEKFIATAMPQELFG